MALSIPGKEHWLGSVQNIIVLEFIKSGEYFWKPSFSGVRNVGVWTTYQNGWNSRVSVSVVWQTQCDHRGGDRAHVWPAETEQSNPTVSVSWPDDDVQSCYLPTKTGRRKLKFILKFWWLSSDEAYKKCPEIVDECHFHKTFSGWGVLLWSLTNRFLTFDLSHVIWHTLSNHLRHPNQHFYSNIV